MRTSEARGFELPGDTCFWRRIHVRLERRPWKRMRRATQFASDRAEPGRDRAPLWWRPAARSPRAEA